MLLSTFSNYLGQIFTVGIWFFLTPFLLRNLGATMYGLWVLVGSVVAYGSLLDFGIASAVTKYVAEYQAKGQIEKARRLVATALWLFTGLGLIAVAFGAILAPVFPDLFNIAQDQRATAIRLVFLSGLGAGVSLPSATSFAVLRGLQRCDLLGLITFIGMSLFALTTVGVLLLGGGLLGMVAVKDRVPSLGRELLHRGHVLDAGIVAEDVDAARLGPGEGHHLADGGGPGQVRAVMEDATSCVCSSF